MRPASTLRSSRSDTTSTSRPVRVKSCAPAASTLGTASGPEVMAPGSAATQARSHSSFPGRSSYSAARGCRIPARYDATGRPSAQGDHPLGLLLVHVARARTVGGGVMHGDHAPHIQRPFRQPERVGYSELIVYLVRCVAVEDYACLVHDLLSRPIRWSWPYCRQVGWALVDSALAAVV
jgi:hypothetical protein